MFKIISILLFLSFNVAFGQKFDLNTSVTRGKTIYTKNCMNCHMIDGKGLERVFPPLIKNSNLTDKKRLINVVIKGMKGPIKVNGVPYDGVMNGFKFTDQQTSDVINYILNSWGNKSEPVLPTEIQPALKAKIKNYQPILIK